MKQRIAGALIAPFIGWSVATAAAEPMFVDVTEASGISFTHTFGDDKLNNIVESVGSGAAFLDYDGDGHLDLYVVNGRHQTGVSEGEAPASGATNRLYRNTGKGKFTDVTTKAGVGDAGSYGVSVTVGDYDNDGDPDLYIANYGENRLFQNQGNGTFRDVTAKAGVGDIRYGVATTFFDADGDGDLDLYVGNYVTYDPKYRLYYDPDRFPGPLAYRGEPDVLYRNNGDGTFADISAASGIANPEGRAMSTSAIDFDRDGDIDLFVANDAMENYLYQNDGKGRFTNVGLEMGVAFGENGEATSAMATCWGDVDGDGRTDLFLSDTAYSSLFMLRGETGFEDRTQPSGLAELTGQYVSWGADFFDFDNDGDRDIYVANGALHFLYGQEDLLLENDGTGRFTDVARTHGAWFEQRRVARGLAMADYDGDGDVDVFISHLGERAVLLRNDGGNRQAWLALRLVGRKSPRDGSGARVTVTVGGKKQVYDHRGASGYLGQAAPRLHFGLGAHQTVDRLEVRWPSGRVQVIEKVPARQLLTIEEPAK